MVWNKGKGKLLTKQGYRRITTPDGRRMLEHRYIMELKINRKLSKKEVVHHINEDRTDNKIENLELLKNHSIHMKKYPSIRCTRKWNKIKVPTQKYDRWNNKKTKKYCIVPNCKRIQYLRDLCNPCYISWWKWKKGFIRNHFSKNSHFFSGCG